MHDATHVKFGENEVIVRVEGYSKFGPPNGFLTQLNFFTKDSSGKNYVRELLFSRAFLYFL